MAWYRTDLYHRVLTTSGTFVNQQWPFNPETPDGAWGFHNKLIPESPKKPLRIYLAVGDRDLLNPNVMRDDMHDWVEANHRMAKVLKAKGYRLDGWARLHGPDGRPVYLALEHQGDRAVRCDQLVVDRQLGRRGIVADVSQSGPREHARQDRGCAAARRRLACKINV